MGLEDRASKRGACNQREAEEVRAPPKASRRGRPPTTSRCRSPATTWESEVPVARDAGPPSPRHRRPTSPCPVPREGAGFLTGPGARDPLPAGRTHQHTPRPSHHRWLTGACITHTHTPATTAGPPTRSHHHQHIHTHTSLPILCHNQRYHTSSPNAHRP